MISRLRIFAAAVAGIVLVCSASAETPVESAIKGNNVVALEALAIAAPTSGERVLAKGAALALRHKDAAALTALEPLAKGEGDAALRAQAYLAMSGVYLRQSRFADVDKTMAAAKALQASVLTPDDLQTQDFAQALKDIAPMAVSRRASGHIAATRDGAGLLRIPVTIDNGTVDAVVDSGAAFCTLSESAAKKLGVKLLERSTTVGSSSKDAVNTHLGVIAKFRVGDAELTNVVAFVLPDSDLSFMSGQYKIDAIMGLPVFEALGRIEVAKEEGKEVFYYGPKSGAPAVGNMLLAGVEPIVLAEAGEAKLRMFLDTGATHTTLNASVVRDYPTLAAASVKDAAILRGAGGSSEDKDAMTLPAFRLSIAGRPFELKKISMRSKVDDTRHGAIGQDILKQGVRWALDFETMSFTVGD